jgi:hypothetical protein
VSEKTWNDVIAIRKKSKPKPIDRRPLAKAAPRMAA